MKAPRYLVQRRDLSSTVEAATPFLQAALALGDRLGPCCGSSIHAIRPTPMHWRH
jgi:uncharacterized protein YecE (DUF72 family)